ncbi:Alanine--glyoxylate aminotransferase 2, mitochondrial, variant 2 [Chamberlinius hualienensis]
MFQALFKYRTTLGFKRCASSKPSMPPCGFTPKKYTGITYDAAMKVRQTNLHPSLFLYYKQPVMLTEGKMQWLFDSNGKRYLDMFAGIVTVGVGHCHPRVVTALKDQADSLWHTTNVYMNPPIHEFAEKIVEKMPGDLKVCYFVNSGSEANDLAIMLARLYTKNFDIITLRNCYHGMSPLTMGLTSLSTWKQPMPNSFGVQNVMNPDPYRGLFGGKNCRDSPVQANRDCDCSPGQCKACDGYIDQLDEVLKYSVPKSGVAGFFAESIQGVGGIVQFPKKYVKKSFEMIRAKGGVCISDEVQTGFGRTGDHYWGFEGHDVIPDIVTMAKSIGNGFPLAAVITTPEIAKSMSSALHLNTFGGNPLACAVGKAVLEVIDEEKAQNNSLEVGNVFFKHLTKLRDEFEIIGDVRGKGLMIGVEFVTDKKSRSPLPLPDVLEIWEDIREMGVLIGRGGLNGNVFRIQPPMIITKDDAKFCVDVIKVALENYSSKRK